VSKRRTPVFVERSRYYRRRLIDCARLLPVLGAFLWMIPMLWALGPNGGKLTSSAMVYLFGVWAMLIVISGFLTRALGKTAADDETGPQ